MRQDVSQMYNTSRNVQYKTYGKDKWTLRNNIDAFDNKVLQSLGIREVCH